MKCAIPSNLPCLTRRVSVSFTSRYHTPRRPQSGIDTIVILAVACVSFGVWWLAGRRRIYIKSMLSLLGWTLNCLPWYRRARRRDAIILPLCVSCWTFPEVVQRASIQYCNSLSPLCHIALLGGKAQSRTLTGITTKDVNVACSVHTGRTKYQTRRLRRPSVRGPSTPTLSSVSSKLISRTRAVDGLGSFKDSFGQLPRGGGGN